MAALIQHSLSKDSERFEEVQELFQIFLEKEESVTAEELVGGLHITLGNLEDIAIDYPNATVFMHQVLESFQNLGVLDQKTVGLYS